MNFDETEDQRCKFQAKARVGAKLTGCGKILKRTTTNTRAAAGHLANKVFQRVKNGCIKYGFKRNAMGSSEKQEVQIYPSLGLFRTMGSGPHALSQGRSQIGLDPLMYAINQRRHDQSSGPFESVIQQGHGHDPIQGPIGSPIERNVKNQERIDGLGYHGGPGGSQPQAALPGGFFDALKNPHIHQLSHQKGGDRSQNNPKSLTKNSAVGHLKIRNTPRQGRCTPKISRRKQQTSVNHNKGITNAKCCK